MAALIHPALWTRIETRLAQISLAGLLLIQLLIIYVMGTQPPLQWVHALYDDAYYYLGVALHLGQGLGSQFHPPLQTNGYQPLWLLLLSGLGLLAQGDRTLLAQLAVALTGLIWLACAGLMRRQHVVSPLAFILTLLLYPFVFCFGMETVLLLPAILLLLRTTPSQWGWRGACFALLFYSRLDALALAPVWTLAAWSSYALPQGSRRQQLQAWWHDAWRCASLTLALILPYLLLNQLWFGLPLPVSGVSKALGAVRGENMAVAVWYLSMAALPLSMVLLNTYWRYRLQCAAHPAQRLGGLCLATAALCALYYGLFSGWPVWDWYAWPLALATLFALSASLHYLALNLATGRNINRGNVAWGMVILCALALIVVSALSGARQIAYGAKAFFKPGFSEDWYPRQNLLLLQTFIAQQPPAVVAMGDRAGSLGYWLPSAWGFIHTEGLVASTAYWQALQAGQGPAFLAQHGVHWLVVDREQYMHGVDAAGQPLLGVVEPIQGLSARQGPYLLCFPPAAIGYQQTYQGQTRYVLDYHQRVSCPTTMEQDLTTLRQKYGALRHFSLPSEAPAGWLNRWLGLVW
ncbi:hypothetical protein [Parvibium lacunae]|uniref:hypothetical protein n=1 Tax=Parvibium lacunae TaxID=1888893 RepID=UPI0011C02B55|nr:hypothetical protein [Parvibium lacunae]